MGYSKAATPNYPEERNAATEKIRSGSDLFIPTGHLQALQSSLLFMLAAPIVCP